MNFYRPLVFFFCNAYCLTTPELGWFQCWFRRPHAAPPHMGLPWPSPEQKSHSRCPCGSPRPSVAFAGTWRRTASPLPSQCTSLQLQTFPWETKSRESQRVISRRQNNPSHITDFSNRFGQSPFCSAAMWPAGPLDQENYWTQTSRLNCSEVKTWLQCRTPEWCRTPTSHKCSGVVIELFGDKAFKWNH